MSKIPKIDAEGLLCSWCNNYLSSSPIFLVPDGKNLCQPCSLVNTDVKVYRQLTLEKVLCDVTFPCQQKRYGCDETYKFNRAADHEYVCEFKQMKCTFHMKLKCNWKGAVGEFKKHVMQHHPSIIQETATFKIEVTHSSNDAFIVITDNNYFLVSYRYDHQKLILYHNVAFYIFNIEKQFCKMQLTNTYDTDHTLRMKGSECVYCTDGLINSGTGKATDLIDVKSLLNNPKFITITLTVNDKSKNDEHLKIYYELLDVNKCSVCKYYLILPIFETGKKFICNDCHYDVKCNAVPSDSPCAILLANQNYPCRWNSCKQVLKGNLIGDHETACKFRLYKCLHCSSNCLLPKLKLEQHLKIKNVEYVEKNIEKKMAMRNENYVVCTYAKHEFVKVEISFLKYKSYYFVSYVTTSNNKNKFKCTVKFKHTHCKAESDLFVVDPTGARTYIYLYDLPKCFLTDEEQYVAVTLQ